VLAGPNRPATVPEGYLVTPMGYFHPSCVKEVASGDILRPDEMAIRHPNGSFSAMHVCAYSHFTADGKEVPLNPSDDTATAKGETVPLGPLKDAKVFPGLQDFGNVKTILQPVLGWNSDFKNAWGIASWNCCVKGTVFKSPGEHTATGHVIYGVIFDQCSAGTLSCGKWTINTKDLTSGAFSKLFNESNFGQTFDWGFGAVLEVYNVARCSDYPSGGKLTSYNVSFYNNKFQKIAAPTWYLWKVWLGPPARSPVCGYGGYLNTSSGSAMTLTY
jgi:hypothetical protein